MKNNYQAGIAPLAIVLIIAVAAAVGGGTYYSKNNKSKNSDVEKEMKDEKTPSESEAIKSRGSIRSLFDLKQNLVCTFSSTNESGTSSGTVYISGSSMRGEFVSDTSSGVKVQSHMVKHGDEVFVWSGQNGAKMNFSEIESMKGPQNTTSGQVDIDQAVDYECNAWNKDDNKFTVPSEIKFMDVGAMMKASTQMKLDANSKIPTGIDVGGGVYNNINLGR